MSIVIVGRRWFRRNVGGTYHSAEIVVNGECIHKISYAYGYDSAYLDSARDWLRENGFLPDIGEQEPLWRYYEKKGIHFNYTVTNVNKKSEL